MRAALILVSLIAIGSLSACGKGEAGPAGPEGPEGPAGSVSTASTTKIVASIYCGGQVSGMTGAASSLNGLNVNYSAALLTSGDVFATANIAAAAFQISGTSYYSVDQVGSGNGSVIVTADAVTPNNFGWWSVELNRATLVVTAVYHDTDLGGSGLATVTFLPSACQSHSY